MTQPSQTPQHVPLLAKMKATVLRCYYRLLTWWAWLGIVVADVDCEPRAIRSESGTVPVRVYRSIGNQAPAIVLYFHGGGWVIGDLHTHDPFCRRLCSATGAIVISVDYRLAPEYAFPTAALDCIGVTRWLLHNKTEFGQAEDSVFIAGDSAGGNLAAVVTAQLQAEFPAAIRGQLLIYPATRHYAPATASVVENATGHGLTRDLMEYFWDSYLQGSAEHVGEPVQHALATPLHWGSFAQLPPAMVITAGLDPLRDEGAELVQKLVAADVPCQHQFYREAEHGFVCHEPKSADHADALDEISEWMRGLTRS